MRVWSERSELTPIVWMLCALAVTAVAVALRLHHLELRPLHHDEGVNGLFMTRLLQPPYSYRYDAANFHGPTLFYLAKPVVMGLGSTTFAIRLVPAVCGIATVLLAFILRRWIGAVGALTATGLLAISPGAVFFSRYFIHEMPLVCFTFTAVLAAWGYAQRPRVLYLLLASASAAMMFATKETAIITLGVLLIAWILTVVFLHVRRAPAPVPQRAVTPSLGRRLALGVTCIALFVAINVMFYSSFFTNEEGVRAALRGLVLWTETGTRDHIHPWSSYVRWLMLEESPILVLGLVGSVVALWRAREPFVVFTALWALGIVAAYSLIPYKTPWLVLNMILPLAILGGWAAEAAFTSLPTTRRWVVVAAGVLSALVATSQAVILNFVQYDNDRYPYVYAHTRREILQLVDRIHQIGMRAPSPITIAIVSPDYMPLPWYLQNYGSGYYGRVTTTPDPVFIGSTRQDTALRSQLGDGFVRSGPYPLRPGVDLVLYVRQDLWSD
jgi:uncharacterized protein (TIGR03663 family)